jgi:hypothetical protein
MTADSATILITLIQQLISIFGLIFNLAVVWITLKNKWEKKFKFYEFDNLKIWTLSQFLKSDFELFTYISGICKTAMAISWQFIPSVKPLWNRQHFCQLFSHWLTQKSHCYPAFISRHCKQFGLAQMQLLFFFLSVLIELLLWFFPYSK